MSEQFPDEVVTQALLRHVTLPGVEKPLALITLDNGHDHTRPSTFGPGGLDSLDAALDRALAADVSGIAVTGKPFVFAVGADLSGVPRITSRDEALEVARQGHRVFARLRDAAVPTFAFVNGAALGGGLELALHADHRTISAGAFVAFPEVFLGLVPGWGGTQLLPHLIGIDAAVSVIVENALAQNRMTSGPRAAKLGIADALFAPADFLESSLEWAAGVLTGRSPCSARTSTRPPGTTRSPAPGRSWPRGPATPRRPPSGPSTCSSWHAPRASPTAPPPRTRHWPTSS